MSETCIYCNLPLVGSGCPYGPKNVHVTLSPGKCIYCKLPLTGAGCPYNPYGNQHVRGIDYNALIKETAFNSFSTGYMINKLSTPITEMPAYKLGLINAQGRVLKKPETYQEKVAYNPQIAYIIRLKKILNEELDILNNSVYLEQSTAIPFDTQSISDNYDLELEVKDKLKHIVENLLVTISDANLRGISEKYIEQTLTNCFLEANLFSRDQINN